MGSIYAPGGKKDAIPKSLNVIEKKLDDDSKQLFQSYIAETTASLKRDLPEGTEPRWKPLSVGFHRENQGRP